MDAVYVCWIGYLTSIISYILFHSLLPLWISDAATWWILLAACLVFTVASIVWVRAFEQPSLRPLSSTLKTDEVLAAILFLVASIPSLPYVLIFLLNDWTQLDYWALMFCSIMLITVCSLFLNACIRSASNMEYRPILYPTLIKCFGEGPIVRRHCGSDWLITTWFCYWCAILATIGCLFLTLLKVKSGNDRQIYIFATGAVDCLFFVIGCCYYLAGSYNPVHVVRHRLSKHQEERRNSKRGLLPVV